MKTKKAISMRLDRDVLAEIDNVADKMIYHNRSFIIEGVLANVVAEMKGDALFRYALQGAKKIRQM